MQPAFSPDGHQLAFVWTGEKDDNPDIYVKLIGEGHTPLRLTSDPAVDEHPAWSPDGQRIAFVRFSQDVPTVFVISALGGKERKLAQMGCGGGRLSWSPDGKFLVMPACVFSQETLAIFLISAASGETRQLTSPPRGSNGDSSVVFSLDGRSVVFVRSPIYFSEENDLYLQDIRPTGVPIGTRGE
jgi:Tol biopolymer transport system component